MTYLMLHWICNLIVFGTVMYLLRDITRPFITRLIPIEKRMEIGFFKFQRKITLATNIVLSILAMLGFHFACGEFIQYWSPTSNKHSNPKIQQFQILAAPVSLPKDSVATPSTPPIEVSIYEEIYYLQIAAFSSLPRAEAYAARWQGHSKHPVRIAVAAYEAIPYKLILGPFPSRKAAADYGEELQVSNFPRTSEGLQIR